MLSGRDLCDGLITRPEESYRGCVCVCISECDREVQKGRPCPGIGSKGHRKKENGFLLTTILFKASQRIWQMLKAHLRLATHQLIISNLHVIIPVKTQTPFAKCC